MAYTTINKSTDYFNTKLWTGTGSSNAITGVGFQPDWVWIKNRSAGEQHRIHDAVRGTNKSISSDTSSSQTTTTQDVMSFDSDGFTLGTETAVNASGQNIVGWNWKANGAGSANSDGSITSTVSVNTTSGFSISTYTGTGSNATVGHGLGVVPNIVLVKSTSNGEHWCMYNSNLGNTSRLLLNLTNAVETSRSEWQSTTPTSSVFSLDGSDQVNGSGSKTYVAYCFAEKQGFSKFGSYTGSGSTDGTFIYTGFKPAFVLIKNADFASNWNNFTGKIPGYNQINDTLQPNLSSAENGTFAFDMLSNGFKHRSGDVMDRNGDTHIYMAFAEAPLVGTNNVPANAR
jgi:hypothetical protein